MDIRRRLLAIHRGGNDMIGDLSKFEKKILTFPNASNVSNWESGAIVPCSFTPKLIVFYSDHSLGGIIKQGVIYNDDDMDIHVGGCRGLSSSGSSSYQQAALKPVSGPTAGGYMYENGVLYICRQSSSIYWSNSVEYTFEIYG